MADDDLERRVRRVPTPSRNRVRSRAASLARDDEPPKDPETAARALLEESDARKGEDPAPHRPGTPDVVRRTSDEATPPPDLPH